MSAGRAEPRELDFDYALGAIAVGAALVVIITPLSVAEYPPMVDLPFHAAQTGALRHYFDPAFHFREQFELHPFAVPYVSMYVIGALCMTVLPMMTAVKVAAAVMLALLPTGLAVLCHGMKKSPLLGVAGLLVVWGPLTNFGFLNFLGALGLFAMVVGLTLLVVDHPSRPRWLALGAALTALFFTHVFRYPFAVAAMAGTALVMAKPTRRSRPVVLAAMAAVAPFVLWMAVRPKALAASPSALDLHLSRLGKLTDWLWGDFNDPSEPRAVAIGWATLVVVAIVSGVAVAGERRASPEAWPPRAWRVRAAVVALGCAGVSLLLFVSLPMQLGTWWYIFPREATATCFLGLAALPDLPRARLLRTALVLAMAGASLPLMGVEATNYAAFDTATEDFEKITHALPQAPKLLYLVFEHGGSTRTVSPFVHLPAYIQAERGGWLSFHFARFGASPLAYRLREGREAIIPPLTPPRWEVTPEAFDVLDRGRFFDWFLVRALRRPDALFAADPSIAPEAHAGTWWLYRRRVPASAADRPASSP